MGLGLGLGLGLGFGLGRTLCAPLPFHLHTCIARSAVKTPQLPQADPWASPSMHERQQHSPLPAHR